MRLATFWRAMSLAARSFTSVLLLPSRKVSYAIFSRTPKPGPGIAALFFLVLFHWSPAVIPVLLRATHQTFSGHVLAQFATCALTVLLLPSSLVSIFLRNVVLLDAAPRAPDSSSAQTEQRAKHTANTLGAIAGATLVTGFWLVPWLGSYRVIAVAAGVESIACTGLERRSPQRHMLYL